MPPEATQKKDRPAGAQQLLRRPDTVILSYPRSGRTWLGLMATWYVARSIGRPDASWDSEPALTSMTPWRNAAYLEAMRDARHAGLWAPVIQFKHLVSYSRPYYEPQRIKRSPAPRKIVLLRDPRDVALSFFHHIVGYRRGRMPDGMPGPRKLPANYSLPEFLYSETLGIRKIVRFMATAANWAHQNDASLIYYEDIRRDPVAGLTSFLEACGLEAPDGQLVSDAVEACAFDRLRAAEARDDRTSGRPTQRIRKGRVGGHREELDPQEAAFVNGVLAEAAHPALARYVASGK